MKIMSHLWGKLQLTPTNELIPTLNPALASGACSQGLELVGFSKLRESLLSALSATSLASSKAWMGFGEGGWIHEVVAMGHGPAPGSSLLPLDTRNRTQAPSDSAPTAPQAAATPTCSHAATCSALSHLPAFQLLFSGPGMPSSCSGIHSKPPPHRSPQTSCQTEPIDPAFCVRAWCACLVQLFPWCGYSRRSAHGPGPLGRALSYPDVASRSCLLVPALVSQSWLLGGLCLRQGCLINCDRRPMLKNVPVATFRE